MIPIRFFGATRPISRPQTGHAMSLRNALDSFPTQNGNRSRIVVNEDSVDMLFNGTDGKLGLRILPRLRQIYGLGKFQKETSRMSVADTSSHGHKRHTECQPRQTTEKHAFWLLQNGETPECEISAVTGRLFAASSALLGESNDQVLAVQQLRSDSSRLFYLIRQLSPINWLEDRSHLPGRLGWGQQ